MIHNANQKTVQPGTDTRNPLETVSDSELADRLENVIDGNGVSLSFNTEPVVETEQTAEVNNLEPVEITENATVADLIVETKPAEKAVEVEQPFGPIQNLYARVQHLSSDVFQLKEIVKAQQKLIDSFIKSQVSKPEKTYKLQDLPGCKNYSDNDINNMYCGTDTRNPFKYNFYLVRAYKLIENQDKLSAEEKIELKKLMHDF